MGEVVAPSVAGTGLTRGAVVTMADLSTLEVEVDVNEAYIGGVQRGQPAEIVLDAYPTLRFPGRVRQIMPTADRQKATVLVRVAIETQDPRILPEMGARVVFLEPTGAEAPAASPPIPRRPRRYAARGKVNVVYVVVGDVVRRRVVDAGPVSGGEREIRQKQTEENDSSSTRPQGSPTAPRRIAKRLNTEAKMPLVSAGRTEGLQAGHRRVPVLDGLNLTSRKANSSRSWARRGAASRRSSTCWPDSTRPPRARSRWAERRSLR